MGGIEMEMLPNFNRKIRKDEATRMVYAIFEKTVLKKPEEMECVVLHWIFVPQKRARWYTLLHRLRDFRVPCKDEWSSVPQIHRIENVKTCTVIRRVSTNFVSGYTGDKMHLDCREKIYGQKLTEIKSKIEKNFCYKSQHFFITQPFTIMCSEIINSFLSVVKVKVIWMVLQIKKKLQVRSVQI